MGYTTKTHGYSTILNIIVWGSIWGMFEATVGYCLHLVSFGYSWLIWYPFACFCMVNIYRKTGRISSILYVGLLCATIKMLNLFLPGRIDKVINPAISIVFEAIAMVAVIIVVNSLFKQKQKNPVFKALIALTMNTCWRFLFVIFLIFLVPDWICEISVISSGEKFVPFFITQNFITSALIFIGYQFKNTVLKPVIIIENYISNRFSAIPKKIAPILHAGLAALLLCININLQFLLR